MTIDEITLYQPYHLRNTRSDPNSFIMFLDKKEKILVLEHNALINSVSIHRWQHGPPFEDDDPKMYDVIKFDDNQYVIRALFKARNFIVGER